MSRERRRQIVREQLDLVSVEYREMEDRLKLQDNSNGLVSRYGANIGGGGGKISDHTAAAAFMDALESPTMKKARDWRGLCARVYHTLLVRPARNEYAKRRDRVLAWLVFQRVMMGRKLTEIARDEMFEGNHLNASFLGALWSELIDIFVDEAVLQGLIP